MSVKSQSRYSLSLSQASTASTTVRRPKYNYATKQESRIQVSYTGRVKSIITSYINKENIKEYEQLVCAVRDNILKNEDLESLLGEATHNVSLLDQNLHLFVEAILSLKWTDRCESFTKAYKSFIINLICAHNYHAKSALDQLVKNFYPVDNTEWPNGEPTEEDCNKLQHVHEVLNTLLKVVPMCRDLLYQSIVSHYPYMKKPAHMHEYYLHNILWIFKYEPTFKLEFLYLIFNRLIILDVNAPREDILRAEEGEIDEDIFGMDDVKSVKSMGNIDCTKHPLAHTLDLCLNKMFNFIISECHDLETGKLNWEKTKLFYQIMTAVFDKIILPTYNIHHVQFVMLFICSLKQSLSEGFLNHLWKKVSNPNVASVHRQTAICYIASFLARASFIPLFMIQDVLQQMSVWVHSYISTQDGLECVNSDVRVHSVFYSVCQALFYVIAFRHKDLTNTPEDIAFLENLNMAKIVTSRLNPLRACQPAIVRNFAAITRTYQLAYCYTIIEHNARTCLPTYYFDEKGSMTSRASILEAFFPFDPYLLKKSSEQLTKLYLEYNDMNETREELPEKDDNDFLSDQSMEVTPSSRHSGSRFSYGTSPGFKYKT